MTTVNNRKVSSPSSKDEAPKEKGFFNRPRSGGKTMWDWLNLLGILAIPLVVVAATLLFGIQQANLANQQHENDQKIANQQHEADKQSALDQQEATILQTYIDNIQDLLLNHNLLGSKPNDNAAILARARTQTALQGLDPERKGRLMQFIYEARLIGFYDQSTQTLHDHIIGLSDADLRGAHLTGVNLNEANLYGANLYGADLRGAHLIGANLLHASLAEATLSYAYLIGATLSYANLSGANLFRANLRWGANLFRANLTGASLNEASLNEASLNEASLVGASLNGADLYHASLRGASLRGASLRSAVYLTQQQLDQVSSCKNAILPPGLTCHHNL